ncbi:MAG: flavodoxin family protein [Clostridiales Family XIII bacterium]|nr:flavodoxin family protein [Clostridiales Family XIII bacterium]
MKALLINGSPNKDGCTFTALAEVAGELEKNGIKTEIFHIGRGPFYGCSACFACDKIGKCAFDGDPCNEIAEKMKNADGVVIGSPVYYAGANGALCALLDRAFFSSRGAFARKPGAAVVSCRRGGAGSAFDRLNKYFTISSMPVVSSQYWNAVHGNTPDEVRQDKEGMQVMRALGRNMAWLMNSIEASKGLVSEPETEPPVATNFIR